MTAQKLSLFFSTKGEIQGFYEDFERELPQSLRKATESCFPIQQKVGGIGKTSGPAPQQVLDDSVGRGQRLGKRDSDSTNTLWVPD